jgi:hypothetical protein
MRYARLVIWGPAVDMDTPLIGSVDGFELTRDDVHCVMLSLLCVLAGPPTPAPSQVPLTDG